MSLTLAAPLQPMLHTLVFGDRSWTVRSESGDSATSARPARGGSRDEGPVLSQQRPSPVALPHRRPEAARCQEVSRQVLRRIHRSYQLVEGSRG